MTKNIKSVAQETIRSEIEGLEQLLQMLGDDFEKAVCALENISGRVIVSGIGKSGHIARKIAATLASTGSPAQFVHPTEAAHGDLGMITENDALCALSWSGETTELQPLIDHAKRLGVPLIALTSDPKSTLARAADITIALPQAAEAGSLGWAPTTSTTIQLVAGDAIAMALSEIKGFTEDDFRNLHPGGALGTKLKRACDIMHHGDEIPLCQLTTRMSQALLEMSSKTKGCIGVLDQAGRLCGIITDGDLRRNLDLDLLNKTAKQVMTPDPKTIDSNLLVTSILELMQTSKITVLFVVKDHKPIGIIHIHDMIRNGIIQK